VKLEEINEYFAPNLYEMSNFKDTTTGLPSGTNLWVRTEPTALAHTKYRIKISHPQKGSAVFSLWGDETQQVAGNWKVTGKDLKRIETLINLTHNTLRKHIDGEEDSADLTDAFRSMKDKVENI